MTQTPSAGLSAPRPLQEVEHAMSTVPAPPLSAPVSDERFEQYREHADYLRRTHPDSPFDGLYTPVPLSDMLALLAEITASRASAARAAVPLTGLPSVEDIEGLIVSIRKSAEKGSAALAREVHASVCRMLAIPEPARQAEAPPLASSPPYDCCPICGGDCAAANPPVLHCPMKEAPPLASFPLAAFTAGELETWRLCVKNTEDGHTLVANANTVARFLAAIEEAKAPPAQPGERTGVGASPLVSEALREIQKQLSSIGRYHILHCSFSKESATALLAALAPPRSPAEGLPEGGE
jgi:hypothetical protein